MNNITNPCSEVFIDEPKPMAIKFKVGDLLMHPINQHLSAIITNVDFYGGYRLYWIDRQTFSHLPFYDQMLEEYNLVSP